MLTIAAALTLTTILAIKRKTITISIDGKSEKIITYQDTVKSALEHKKIPIGSKDSIQPTLDTKLAENDTISIKRAVSVKVKVDGTELSLLSAADNLDTLLKEEGIALNPEDKTSMPLDTKVSEGLSAEITRVETKTFTESVPVDFSNVVQYDNEAANTVKKVVQNGEKGEKQVTTKVVYENGKEVLRNVVNETIVKNPVDNIVVLGTLPVVPMSRGGDSLTYSKVIKARATAYSPLRNSSKAYTASGRQAVRNPDGYSTIAVDPSVIPLGTKVYVEGYGLAIAADTGSAIVNNTIDVFFNTYGEACSWGVKYVNVYILK